MDDLFKSYVLEFEFSKLMLMPKTKAGQIVDEDENDENNFKATSKILMGFVYEKMSPHETFY